MNKFIPLAGMTAILVLAYGFDRFLGSFEQTALRTFDVSAFLLLIIAENLLFAGSLLMLIWFVLFRGERSQAVSSIFLVIGFLLVFSIAVLGYLPSSIVPVEDLRIVLMSLFFLTPNSFFFRASAFVAVIGIAGLINWPRR